MDMEEQREERTMAIAQIPQQVSSAAKNAAQGIKERAAMLGKQPPWPRTLAVSALITGAVLLITGRRKAGLAVTAAGAAMALLEEPEEVKTFWRRIPSYIDNGKRLLLRLEGFIEDFSSQGDRVRSLLEKAQR
jgi:hypothetical protein